MQVHDHFSLKAYNTFGIDATARHFAVFHDVEELRQLLAISDKEQRLVLGGGSNILLTKNFDGFVLKNELKGKELVGEDDNYFYVKAYAGEVWHEFVLFCIDNNYPGLENLSLIPGCVGASPMQNIGAYGVEIKDVFHQLEALHVHDKTISIFNANDCRFGYRESIFKRALKDQYIILNVTFRLPKKAILHVEYGAIRSELEKMQIDNPGIRDISNAVIRIRTSKLPDPKVTGNAGSFFKNPVLPAAFVDQLKQQYPEMPVYTTLHTDEKKIAAGWLIEQAGWKGYRKNDAGVHPKQALVLVNYGTANGDEIYTLSRQIIDDVKNKFGIELEREVNIVGR
ncbi:UDP-N-acetylmuramate dehydrogenase [Haoranjiania flava]|uniref:UDP-N-acetylenolpyruvoylglucosamine reductase n=1 Tax=Haoranjiania flava TaxID=1856322 RepID=A0AAE3IMU4_9BACT|nr:UDP-N-acetylmuramate dehydrogenase [Haoranjiania flava]MCU7694504.1 UDP-N-acetylmuramate dehydrogenase [Haoranjiania flava]